MHIQKTGFPVFFFIYGPLHNHEWPLFGRSNLPVGRIARRCFVSARYFHTAIENINSHN